MYQVLLFKLRRHLCKGSIAALVFEFYNSILTNKIHCTYHEMQAASKTNKNERGIWGGGGPH